MEYPFTPVPNWFFPLARHLNESEIRIMLVVWDQTVGFAAGDGSRQVSNTLAYTFLQQQTGISSRSTISRALTHLEELGLITRSPKRMHGQLVSVSPKSPIIAKPLVHSVDSQSPVSGLSESTEKTHIKKPSKKLFKDTTMPEKFTQEQEDSSLILVAGGLEKDISRQLVVTAWKNGRGIDYINQVVGYVASIQAKNPPGMIRSLIERNSGRIRASEGQQGPSTTKKAQPYHYYDDGGPELIQHTGERRTCPICAEPDSERREAGENGETVVDV